MRFVFKFRNGIDKSSRQRVIDLLQGRGVGVEQLLDTTDEDLSSVFVAIDKDEKHSRNVLQLLRSQPEVEYADADIRRGLK